MKKEPESPAKVQPTIWRCFSGSAVSSAIAYCCYLLTSSISQTFANKPIHSDNPTAIAIAGAVRTLVVGISTLATFVFTFAAMGLIALGIQILIQRFTRQQESP
jgi:hypothetical protein